MSYHKEVDHLMIPLEDILLATNKFANDKLIAKGGFGSVFKGHSEKHGTIAVKRLDRWQGQGEREFKMEIQLLSIYKQENIVSLFGFCDENGEKIHVYKHERNGSLDKHLKSKNLSWIQRLQICLDAACGLKYLHDDVGDQHRIIHCDIKSSNILLDENGKAKISDFGLSKVGPANVQRSFLISNACGTLGYVDPEYIANCILTQKSDVYSFGVVLFEVLCGRLVIIQEYKDDRRFLTRLGRLHYENGTLDEIIDSDLRGQMDSDSLSKFSTIAYRCLEKKGEDRPKMSLVVEQLQEALYVQQAFIEQSSVASSSKSSNETVFISFRGEDISKTFVDHLYSAFVQRGIYTYLSDQTVAEDELVNPSVDLKDIQKSHIAIIIFSKNCMTRRFLEEIAYIMECMDERGQIVKPIYYGVDYLHMQKEIENHKDMFSKEVVSWIDAVMDANNLSGWRVPENSANWYDSKCIDQIEQKIH